MRRVAAVALLLAGCAAQPPVEEGRREASVPAVAPMAQRAVRPTIQTTWSFEAGSDECRAVAASGRTSLLVEVRRDAPIRVIITLPVAPAPGRVVALRFSGPAGNWQAAARPMTGHQLGVALGSDDTALSRVLLLLSGGVLELGEAQQRMPSLVLAPSAADGRRWFDCARRAAI